MSWLLCTLFVWAYGFHEAEHIAGTDAGHAEVAAAHLDVAGISSACGGACDRSDHHHDSSPSDHADNCLICHGSGIAFHKLADSFVLIVSGEHEIIVPVEHGHGSATILSAVSPRGPPETRFNHTQSASS